MLSMIKKLIPKSTKNLILPFVWPFRNKFLLFDLSKKTKKNQVNLNYWSEAANVGDAISPVVVEHMLKIKGINSRKSSTTKHLYAIGSVLGAGLQDATVWGSGILNTELSNRLRRRKLDIRSTRGPLTAILLQEKGHRTPKIYGDPAILMSDIYKPKLAKKTTKYGLVMHMDQIQNVPRQKDTKIIDIQTKDYASFIDDINSVDIVISSSLHGIILAETYGKKAILLQPTKDIFKYYDYYYSTGRTEFPIAQTIEEAKTITPAIVPDFTDMKRGLYSSFPYDIYEEQ